MSDIPSDDTDGYRSVAELDDAVAAGRISFDRYWTVRTALDDLAARQREEHVYDPAPQSPAAFGHTGRTATPADVMPGFVTPLPGSTRPTTPPRSPKPLVPPPPAAGWQPSGPVTLPMAAASADAAETRADDRRRRGWRRSAR